MTHYAKRLSLFLLILLCAVFCACKASVTDHEKDPHGLIQAEEDWETSDRLLKCSNDPTCLEHAQALFWVAAHTLSEASAEEREIDADEYGLHKDMSTAQILERLEPHIGDIVPNGPPNYSKSDPIFIRGLKLMHAAYDAGSIYAANELGLLYFQEDSLKDLDAAERYLTDAFEKGDATAAYNLARIAHERDSSNYAAILKHLKDAGDTNQGNMRNMYMLGLEAFGNDTEVSTAKRYLKKRKGELSSDRRDFRSHFDDAGR